MISTALVGCLDLMRILHADDKLFNALGQAMVRVDDLRVKLKRADLLPEFMMRRAILRARYAIMQRNTVDAARMLKVLTLMLDDDHSKNQRP